MNDDGHDPDNVAPRNGAALTGVLARPEVTIGDQARDGLAHVALITQDTVLDSILDPYRAALGPSLYAGYRNHAYRMVNFARALTPPERDRDERLAVMAAFHDLPFCLSGNLDYLDPAADLADAWLEANGRTGWREEIRHMIAHHHKIRPYRGPFAALVEATRKADWIDVTFGALRFGLPRSYVREVEFALPLDGFYPGPAWRMVARYAAKNLLRPIPNLRW